MNKFASRIFFAALLLAPAFAVLPGAASAQGLRVELDPADGVAPVHGMLNEECDGVRRHQSGELIKKRTVVTGRKSLTAQQQADNEKLTECLKSLSYGAVRITPSFDSPSDYPSTRTLVKILPITPSVRVRGVRVDEGARTAALQAMFDAAVQAARDATQPAVDAAKAELEAAKDAEDSPRISRAADALVRVSLVQEYAVNAARKAAEAKLVHNPGFEAIDLEGIDPRGRPAGYVPLLGDQYAVFGKDYYLSGGQFTLMPDGTITPPFIEVRGLKKTADRDKAARFGLYASSGDKKYNRATGGSAAEVGILFKARPAYVSRVELYLAPTISEGGGDTGIVNRPHQGLIVEKMAAGVPRARVLKARLHDPYSGESIAADADIHLKLGALPLELVPARLAEYPATFFRDTDATQPLRTFQPMQDTLTIPAGESSALTAAFIILPAGFEGDYKVPAPVIVDAADNPVTTEMTTVGRSVSLVYLGEVSILSDNNHVTPRGVAANQRVVESQAHTNQIGGEVGALEPGAYVSAQFSLRHYSDLINVTVGADDTSGAVSVDADDFLQRMPDGSFAPLADGDFPDTYRVPVPRQASQYEGRFNAPIWLRRDGLVEGEETFKFTLAGVTPAVVTIEANGSVALSARLSATDTGMVTGELQPSHNNFGISVGASGGNITYANSDSSISLVFTDTLDVDGAASPDGLLTGQELVATDTWTFSSSAQQLTAQSALPGNLQASQFPAATLDTSTETRISEISFADTNSLTLPENGAAGVMLRIDPPLSAPAVVRIAAIGAADGNSFTATAAGGDFADLLAMQEITLPTDRGSVEVAISHVVDDLIVEPNESFQVELQRLHGDPFVLKSGATTKDVEITNDDSATFTVEPNRRRRLRAGESVELTGRLDTIVQVSDDSSSTVAEISVAEQTRSTEVIQFFDADQDGYLRKTELLSNELLSSPLALSVDFRTRSYDFSALTLRNTDLPAGAFLFPRAADDGRADSPWNADLVLAAEKIAPLYGGEKLSPILRGEYHLRAAKISEFAGAGGVSATVEADARSRLATGVMVKLSADVDEDVGVVITAHYDPDGESGLAPRSVAKTLTITGASDSTMPVAMTFSADDFFALGVEDDARINQPKIVTTSIAFDTATQRVLSDGVEVFSELPTRGPDIVFEDDESITSGMRVFLADANGRQITHLEAGKRTDAFVVAEVERTQIITAYEIQSRSTRTVPADARALSLDAPLAVNIALSTAGLRPADLGNPSIPGAILIPAGESRAMSAQAVSITPSKPGVFSFVVRGITPESFGVFTAASHVQVAHSVVESDAQKWLVTLDETAVEVSEGDTGLTAAVTLQDAASELPAPFVRGGSEEAVTLHYAIGAVADGATDADLSFATTPASTAGPLWPRLPCQSCAALFGLPLSTGSVTIAAGESSAQIPLPGIVGDGLPEAPERFTLMLTALVDAGGLPLVADGAEIAGIGHANSVADYTIAASDGGQAVRPIGAALFATPLLVLQEGLDADASDAERSQVVSSGVITIIRPDDAQGTIRGEVRGVDGETSGALDYELDSYFELAPAQYSTSVRVTALADDVTELHETFQVELFITEPENVEPPASATEVIVLDNDRPVELELAETAINGEENELLEVAVRMRKDGAAAPLREMPVFFTLTPAFGTASAADFLVTVTEGGKRVTREAASVAELTVDGVLGPDETETTVRFPVTADGAAEGEETLSFTLSFADSAEELKNTHDSAITIGANAGATVTIAASTASVAANVLVITPTALTRVYGEDAPAEYAYTVAPQDGSAFETGDTADTDFFTANPVGLITPQDVTGFPAGIYRFQLADSPSYASGIDAKYDFVLADVVYTITPKEITFTGDAVDKVYDGTVYAPQAAFAGGFATDDVETGDAVHVAGGVYAGKDAGDGQTITGFGLGGADAGNYRLASASAAGGDITAREISNLRFAVDPQPPTTAFSSLTPNIDRANIASVGVLPAEIAGFRNGLRFSAAYTPAPTAGSTYQPVAVIYSGAGCDDGGTPVDCGIKDNGDFTAANYALEGASGASAGLTFSTSGLIAGLPGKPGSVEASRSRDEKSATVSWAAPADTGVPNGVIGKYHLRWRSAAVAADANALPPISAVAAGSWRNASGDSELGQDVGAATRHTIRGLIPGRGYEVQVQAENEFGASGRSGYSDTVTLFGKPPPPAFTGLSSVVGETQLRADFRAPAEAGGGEATALVRWRVRAPQGAWLPNTGGSTGFKEITRGESNALIGDGVALQRGVEYEVQLALRNDYGIGAWSESRFATVPSSVETAPATMQDRVFASSYGGPNIEVTWIPPADGGARISEYDVRWWLVTASSADADAATVAAGGRNAHVIRNLSESTYIVEVRARNAVGDGVYGRAAHAGSGGTSIMTGGGPSASEAIVPLVEAIVHGDRQLTLNWRPPLYADGTVKDYGVAITAYRVRWREYARDADWLNAAGAAGEEIAPGDANSAARRSYTITGLANGVTYEVEFWLETDRSQTEVDAYLATFELPPLHQALDARVLTLKSGRTAADTCRPLADPREAGDPCITTYAFDANGLPVFVDADGNDVARNADGSLPASAVRPKMWVARTAVTPPSIAARAATTPDYAPRVALLGTPSSQQRGIPILNPLALGEQILTIAAAWGSAGGSVSAYQLRWRPVVAGGVNQKNWQVSGDISGFTYLITEYTRDDPVRRVLREVEYEAQARAQRPRQ